MYVLLFVESRVSRQTILLRTRNYRIEGPKLARMIFSFDYPRIVVDYLFQVQQYTVLQQSIEA